MCLARTVLSLCLPVVNIECFLVFAQGGQQHAQSTAQLFGGMQKPEQQQQPQQGLSDFQKLLQQALPKQQQQHQSPQPLLSPQQLPAVSHPEQAVPRPQPSSKAPESPAASRQPPVMPTQQELEPVAAAPKRKAAAPKKVAPGPAPQAAAAPTPAWAMPEQAPLSLAGVQLEQQQQQLPDWGLSSEAPASPKKAEPKAPWGAAKPPVPGWHHLQMLLHCYTIGICKPLGHASHWLVVLACGLYFARQLMSLFSCCIQVIEHILMANCTDEYFVKAVCHGPATLQ